MRPQLLDRFGLCVNVATMQDTKARTQMVLDRLAYEQARCSLCTELVLLPQMDASNTFLSGFLADWCLMYKRTMGYCPVKLRTKPKKSQDVSEERLDALALR